MARAPVLHDGIRSEIAERAALESYLTFSGKSVHGSRALMDFVATELLPHLPSGVDPLIDAQLVYSKVFYDFLVAAGRPPQAARSSADNSWRSVSGSYFQDYVLGFINSQVDAAQMQAVAGAQLQAAHPRIVEFLHLPAKRRCTQRSIEVWPDNDIVVIGYESGSWRAEAIVSCKTSLRERTFESAFWTLATRDTGVRSLFVTADLDDELGDCGGVSKNRQIAETYFDRSYSTNSRTRLCRQVCAFSSIVDDLARWTVGIPDRA